MFVQNTNPSFIAIVLNMKWNVNVFVCINGWMVFSLIRFKYNEISNKYTRTHILLEKEKEMEIGKNILNLNSMYGDHCDAFVYFNQSTALVRDRNPCIFFTVFFFFFFCWAVHSYEWMWQLNHIHSQAHTRQYTAQ